PSSRRAGKARAELRRRVARAVVHDDDLDRVIGRREQRADAALDVHLLVASGDDDRNEGPVRLRRVIAEAGAATNVANHEQRQEQGGTGGGEATQSSFSPSAAATAAAAGRGR